MAVNYKQIYARKKANEELIKKVCPSVPETSGIYVLTRTDENGFRYAYVGQAKNLLSRLASHLEGYTQHIDRSIKKHGFFDADNPTGWWISCAECSVEDLDFWERTVEKNYADAGYQLRNKTSGGQDSGKRGIAETKHPKGYYDGVADGRNKLAKELRRLFDLHLTVGLKKDTKLAQRALCKFWDLIGEEIEE